MKEQILFIGLGQMGLPMAYCLLKKGYCVFGFDLASHKKDEFERAGGKWLTSLDSLPSPLKAVVTMLPGGQEMKDFYLHNQKAFSFFNPSTLILDCSTASPDDCMELHQEAQKNSLRLLCAPVSGGTAGAQAGTLTFMVGGDKQDLEEAKPLFSAMGKNIFHAGSVEQGQVIKICNNMLLAIHMVGTSEAFLLGEALGVDPHKLNEILLASSGNNWSLEKYNPYPHILKGAPSCRDYEGGFSVRLMLKDLTLALQSMSKAQQKSNLGTRCYELYKEHLEKGFEQKDFSHIFQGLKNKKITKK